MRNGKDVVDVPPRETTNRSPRLAAFRRLAARPTNEQDAADYFARLDAAKGTR